LRRFSNPPLLDNKMRLGSQYRLSSLEAYGLQFPGERVLDVGSHDGIFLASLNNKVRIGVDTAPRSLRGTTMIVQADGRQLPFRSDCFDQTVALDVIEHVPDGECLVQEIIRVTHSGGQIFITTPSAEIRMFPGFITGWISLQWGHHWRRGYTESQLEALIGDECTCSISQWNALAYRLWYLPLRLLFTVWPGLALRLTRRAAQWDALHTEGHRGFYWIKCQKR
jgi:SAM-dependent methyltransferase